MSGKGEYMGNGKNQRTEQDYRPPVRFDSQGRRYITGEDVARSPIWRKKIKWLAEHGDELLSDRAQKR